MPPLLELHELLLLLLHDDDDDEEDDEEDEELLLMGLLLLTWSAEALLFGWNSVMITVTLFTVTALCCAVLLSTFISFGLTFLEVLLSKFEDFFSVDLLTPSFFTFGCT
jgi:hypothetical protein